MCSDVYTEMTQTFLQETLLAHMNNIGHSWPSLEPCWKPRIIIRAHESRNTARKDEFWMRTQSHNTDEKIQFNFKYWVWFMPCPFQKSSQGERQHDRAAFYKAWPSISFEAHSFPHKIYEERSQDLIALPGQ